jgi:hypothetical protein
MAPQQKSAIRLVSPRELFIDGGRFVRRVSYTGRRDRASKSTTTTRSMSCNARHQHAHQSHLVIVSLTSKIDADARKDTDEGRPKTLVQSTHTALAHHGRYSMRDTLVRYIRSSLKCQSRTNEVERICEETRGHTGHSSRAESLHRMEIFSITKENLLVAIVEKELKGRCGSDANNVRKIAAKEAFHPVLSTVTNRSTVGVTVSTDSAPLAHDIDCILY